MTQNNVTTAYTYDANNRLWKETVSGIATTYAYDANGNMISALKGGNAAGAYAYNLFGNQTSFTTNDSLYTYYTYRPDGLRHSIGDTVHIWDGSNIVADIDGSNVSVYIRGINLIYADDGDKTYYHFNAHGDVVVLTNSNGSKTKSYAYNAFGVEYNEATLDSNPFRYCGEYYDKETQTIYLRARYYNAEQGRFTQEDPIRDGYNWYSYCYQNPLSYIDPNGMAAMDCLDFDDDPADGVDVISFGFCGGGGRGQVSPIISPYDSTSYSNYMARSHTARYDASLGGYYSGGISSATANPDYYALYYEPTVGDDQINHFDDQSFDNKQNDEDQKNYNAYIPEDKQVLNHIFRNKAGHISDSLENRKVLTEVTLTENFLGIAGRGNSWYAKTLDDGRQIWVEARGGKIWDGGINSIPRPWDDYYGLKNHKR